MDGRPSLLWGLLSGDFRRSIKCLGKSKSHMELDTEGLDSIVGFDTLALLQEAETSHTRRETIAIGL